MQEPNLDPARTADQLFADIEAYVDEALATLDAGEYNDLPALRPSIDALCERVKHLRADEAQYFVPRLEALRAQLDVLNDAMQEAKERVAEEIESTHKRQRALSAYLEKK